MSTRATIKIVKEGSDEKWMYHHCDGYPKGVGRDLLNYLSKLTEEMWFPDKITEYLNNKDCSYEFTECQHGDEEYAYLIDCDKHTLTCYSIGWDEFDWKEDKVVYHCLI